MVQMSVERLRTDPVYFVENVLNLELHKAQKKILECDSRFISIRAARRFGKSFIFSSFAVWKIATHSNYRVMIVSKAMRQSTEMFGNVKWMVNASPMAASIIQETQTLIKFSNGSSIQCLPGGNGDSIRGFTIDLILVDEAAYVRDSLFAAIAPMIISTNGSIVQISTPNTNSGEFWRSQQPESEYKAFHFTHDDAIFEDGRPLVDPEELEREKIRCGGADSPEWLREYRAEFGSSEGAFFGDEGIDSAFDVEVKMVPVAEEEHEYVIGVDLGFVTDYTVIVVLDITNRDFTRVVNIERFNGCEPDEVMSKIVNRALFFKPKKILVDSTGLGFTIVKQLKNNNPRIPFDGLNFNRASKPEIFANLNVLLARNQIGLPMNEQLRRELASFHYEKNSNTNNVKLEGAHGEHDDCVCALALAVHASGIFKAPGTLGIGTNHGVLTKKRPLKQFNINIRKNREYEKAQHRALI